MTETYFVWYNGGIHANGHSPHAIAHRRHTMSTLDRLRQGQPVTNGFLRIKDELNGTDGITAKFSFVGSTLLIDGLMINGVKISAQTIRNIADEFRGNLEQTTAAIVIETSA